VREAEAEDVAGVIRTALEEEWQVFDDRTKQWRTVALDDIAVLVPARTSLPQLEESLDAAKIPSAPRPARWSTGRRRSETCS
jgi:ATP-dependent exoDNAse (exonuclease V) beta subunit